MNADTCEVIVTADNADWLAEFTRQLVTERLAACGQNISAIRSIYRWQGVIEDAAEARVALHTRRSLVPEIVAKANQEHPYEVPCVIALPLIDGNPAYLQWIMEETREPTTP
jgi:periplasmic divalent cation tolerance protein